MTRAVEENYRITSALDTRPGRNLDPVNTPLSLQAEDENAGESQPFQLTRSQQFDPLKEPPVHDRLKRVSTSSNPTLATSEGSLYGRTAPSSPPSLKRAHSLSQSTRDRISHEQCPIEQPLYDGSGGSRAVDQVFGDDNSDAQEQHSANQSEDLSSAAFDRSNFMQTLTSTMHELHQVRPQEPSVRPIRYEPQNQTHKPDLVTFKIFEASITEELQIRRLAIRDWLGVATWWLLKARATLANCNRHTYVRARGSMSPSTDSKSPSHQAYIDLLKASYILYDVVLKDESLPALVTDENRKSIADLSDVSSR
jgi:hypothetical protein